ncbi:MAG: Stp1/IreP family PP2C-type Ser/Thr phosphatase [Bdellovibrionales bacterium]|nr:Stp1/IreP family PP2C-type Ser/Thr phosphatase [Bdellovibrionales bacterium]
MVFEVWGQTDVGLKREINQDSILVDENISLFIVADGMGGHKGGEVASAMAVESVQEIVEQQLNVAGPVSPRDILKNAYREASKRIYTKSTRENPELMGMGTTMVLALEHKNKLYIANVGDSRAYLFKDNNLWQITEDHSLINEQIRAGILQAEDPEAMVGRNVITRSVGFEEEVNVDIVERMVEPGELFLLCSDGLCGLVSNELIAELCRKNSPAEIVSKGIEAAKAAGGDDNISVIVFKAK